MKPYDDDESWRKRRDQIIGLGEKSFRKNYYPQLQKNLNRLKRFRSLLDHTSDFVLLIALPDGSIVDVNEALGRILNESVDNLIGQPFISLGITEGAAVLETLRQEMVAKTDDNETISHSMVVAFGPADSTIWLELTYSVARMGEHCYGILVGRDVTERRRNEEIVVRLLSEKQALLDNTLVGIVLLRERQIVSCNHRFEEIFGYKADALTGQSIRLLFPDEESFRLAEEQAYGSMNRNHSFNCSLEMITSNGTPIWVEATGRSVDSSKPRADSIWVFTDISERRDSEYRARFLAYHDMLTGLPNRALFQDRLIQTVAVAIRKRTKIALLVVDLDRFKNINDSLGHSVGDKLLIEVAKRMKACFRDTDTICRLGGDEFLVLIPDLIDAEFCIAIFSKLATRLSAPFHIDDLDLSITVSVGIAIYPDDGTDLETLQKKADTAMYRAKDGGRNTYRFFNHEMNNDALDRLAMHSDLRRALERDQFQLHYQPQFEIASGVLLGAEALLRWVHPDAGMIPPSRFIPLAEENGLIVPIGEWVLNEACREAVNWQSNGLPNLRVAVNLSAIQFMQGNIEATVTQALKASGLDPFLLELELTESILIQETEKIMATVMRLKQMGVKLSIDDFGTGYSSLAYLKRFKVDKLKVDQSFIRNLAHDPENAAIVRAIVHMAHGLGLQTISEGVEDEHSLHHLHQYHCDEAQGYYFSRPLPAAELISTYQNVTGETYKPDNQICQVPSPGAPSG